jgi:hypothetical protein
MSGEMIGSSVWIRDDLSDDCGEHVTNRIDFGWIEKE